MKKMKKNKSKLIFGGIILCLTILVILIISLSKINQKVGSQQNEEYLKDNKDFQEFSKKFEEETVLPRKIYELYDYSGEYENEDLFRNMKNFQDYIEYLKNNVSPSNSKEFFDQYSSDIKENLGMTSYEEFETFIGKLQSYNVKVEDFKYAEIVVGSSYTENGYFVFDINFYYGEEDSPEKVTFTVRFSQTKSTNKPMVKYEFKEKK